MSSRIHQIVALAIVLPAVLATYGFILDLEFVGYDTLPMILTSRVDGSGDLVSIFTVQLMAGRLAFLEFYRPLTAVTLAGDWALWGLDPFGFHLTDLILLCVAAVGVYFAAQRLFSPGWLPLIAALSFALHPAHMEALPVTARRPDYLSMLFTLLAVCALPVAGTGPLARSAWLCAGLVLGALGTKETGLVAVGLVVALALAESHGGPSARLRDVLRRTALSLGAAVLFVGARTAVLGGVGGYAESSVAEAFLRLGGTLKYYGAILLMPQPLSTSPDFNGLLHRLLAVALVGAIVILVTSRDVVPAASRRGALESLGVLLCWIIGLGFVTAVSGVWRPWYVVPFLPVYALAFAFVATGTGRALRAWRRWVAMPVAGAALLLTVGHLRHSGLFHDYVEWGQISRHTELFLERTQNEIQNMAPGEVVVLNGSPYRVMPSPLQVAPRTAFGVSYRSVQAWTELVLPDRPVHVTRQPGESAQEHTAAFPNSWTRTLMIERLAAPIK